MSPETRAKLVALGNELTPPMLGGTSQLMASMAAAADASLTVTRDHQYGPHERNRLDIFTREGTKGAPVLVYIHGGAFVMGDKTSEGSPFYDNVSQWAAQQGWVGVTMTYRLAPASQYPSGPEDLALAVNWLRENIAEHGGDPDSIFLMGQSAGAAHVAGYLSHPEYQPGGSAGIAGGLMISGIYNTNTAPVNDFNKAYYGEDDAVRIQANCTPGLLASNVPMLFTVSELDPQDFQDQAAQLVGEWHKAKGCYPPMEYLAGHNHLTPAQAIGTGENTLGPAISEFIRLHKA
jgi:triacylglycerol lipase